MTVTKRVRFEVLRRDDHTCRYCGGRAPDVVLNVDHVTPVALGGGDHPSNLVTACKDCNAGKTSVPPGAPLVADVAQDAMRWAAAMAAAAEAALRKRDELIERVEAFQVAWDRWQSNSQPLPLEPNWEASVHRWLAAGMPMDLITDSIPIAMTAKGVKPDDVFRYAAKVVWNQIRQLQESAHASLTPATAKGRTPCGHCWSCLHPEEAQETDDYCSLANNEPLADDEEPAYACDHCNKPNCLYPLGWEDGSQEAWSAGNRSGWTRGLHVGQHGYDLVTWHIDGARGKLVASMMDHLGIPYEKSDPPF